jgi:hypothetical protein
VRARWRHKRRHCYASLLCPTLAMSLGRSLDNALSSASNQGVDALLTLAAQTPHRWTPGVDATGLELKILRTLLRDTAPQRLLVAKQCYALIGARLDAQSRLRGVRTLRAAAAFGTARLARMVKVCVPLAQAPERRLAMLDRLWHRVGPHKLPQLLEVCRPILEQRSEFPDEAADAMERIVGLMVPNSPTQVAQDRRGELADDFILDEVEDSCREFLGDDNENVMLSSRILAARHAVGIVRRHVPDALPFAPVLCCVELFVYGMAQKPCSKTQTLCQQALQTLTGQNIVDIAVWRPQGALAPPVPAFAPSELHLPDSEPPASAQAPSRQRLWRNITLSVEGAEPVGMGELCSLIWQAIHRFRDPEQSWAQTCQTRANMRYALVCALAECHEQKGIVCPVGISQRLLTVLQGYLPFSIDGVDEGAHPQAVVTYMLQSFSHQCQKQEDALSSEEQRLDYERGMLERVDVFYQAAMQSGTELFEGRQADFDTFKTHLATALKLTYEAQYLEADESPL